jgi:glycosyltransferase involved in cell wall biosynthesis
MRVVGVEPDEAEAALPEGYWRACRLVEQGQYEDARRIYAELEDEDSGAGSRSHLLALIRNDLAVLAVLDGRHDDARQGWQAALDLDSECLPARLNRDLLAAELDDLGGGDPAGSQAELVLAPNPARMEPRPRPSDDRRLRVAVLSFLFNWPSTGGGNMHTAGLAEFLARAGYEVRHVFARFSPWGIGRIADPLPGMSEVLEFDQAGWNVAEIQSRYRRAVEAFRPDYVVISDAWNMKPLLAEAVRGFPYFLLFQGQENLCPLNNLRLLADGPDRVRQCPRNQLATPDVCHRCLAERGHHAGALHQVERALAGVGTPEYDQALRRSLQEAEAVLALNPLTAAVLEPFARCVRVVPWGLDPARFHWPPPDEPREGPAVGPVVTLFMAAVAGEFIKGFHVAHEACRLLRQDRSDFELVVTFSPPGPGRIDEFTRSVGWCSQDELPRHYRAADVCLVPTIAQDGLSITSVEAMASGLPVIASRIGGVPYTVGDGLTGLLFEPGDAADLARQIARLLDDPDLRRRMGLAGRKRFEEDFTWETVIERHWRPLLAKRAATGARASPPAW